MNSASRVNQMILDWKAQGLTKGEIVRKAAEACMGWPYVWGAYGQNCTPAKRLAFMNRDSIGAKDAEMIRKRCQQLSGTKAACDGCKYFPGGERTLICDCRGFTRWLLQQVGISLQGAGATSQWNTAANWAEKGLIKDMPRDRVCCVFKQVNGKTMEHTGMYTGNGVIIHCSVEVKKSTPEDKSWGWTHYAIPNGLDGTAPVPEQRPTLRKGSSGQYVTLLQTKLIQLDYDLSPYGADGSFGAKTLSAVKAFQGYSGLTADGIVGPKTWAALDDGKVTYYRVTVSHVSKGVADDIITKYGGTKTAEEG